MKRRQRLSGPIIYRTAEATVIDKEQRRVRLSFSSEEPYLRQSWFDEPWVEVLGHNADEVDMSRVENGGAPVLWGHNGRERESLVGVVEKAWLKDKRGEAEVRLSKRASVADLWLDVEDGIVRNVSVGYEILERQISKENKGQPNEYRVTRWRPMEVSLVPVPADATVGVGRSDDVKHRFIITDLEERQMETTTVEKPAKPDDAAAREAAVRAAQDAERKRVQDITELVVKRAKLPESLALELINSGATIEAARERVIDERVKASPDPRNPSIQIMKDEVEKSRDAAVQWMLSRCGSVDPVTRKPVNLNDNPCRGMKLLDLGRWCLERAGVRTASLLPTELATRLIANTTSDFPVILENVMHKQMIGAFNLGSFTWRDIAKVGNLSDFRPHVRYVMGTFSDLAARNEAGEYADGQMDDARKETITAAAKGRIVSFTREMLVNDDMEVFSGIMTLLGRAANRTLENDFYALLALNSDMGPTMADGVTLFHANHQNTGTGAPTMASFEAGINTLKTQKLPNASSGATDYIDVVQPPTFLGPLALGGEARTINEAQYDPDTASKLQRPNKSRGLIGKIVTSPRRPATVWHFFAVPEEAPVIEVGFLDGVQEPQLVSQDAFRQNGISWRVSFEYGIAAVSWLGCFRSTGA